jgi:hypothetical protein
MTLNRQMPCYKSHKLVWALQILEVQGHTLTFVEPGFEPITVDIKVFTRYIPVCGDYYVQYEDGYISISPKQAFKDGYTRV